MFTLMNDFNALENIHGKVIDIIVLSSVMMPKPKLVIETIPEAQQSAYCFDIYNVAQEAMRSFQLGEPGKGDSMFFAGTLQPFHHRVNNELVKEIEKVVKIREAR